MSNPCSETLLIFHFPEAIQNKFVLKFDSNSSTPHGSKTILCEKKR